MIKEALEYLINLRRPETVEIGDRILTRGDLNILREPVESPIHLSTLTGFVDFLKAEMGKEAQGIVVVDSPTKIAFLSQVFGAEKQRDKYAVVEANIPERKFNNSMPMEQFIIWLQSSFIKTDMRDELLKLSSAIRIDDSNEIRDDGISQTATAKTGIAKLENVTLPNPVALQPYRTFQEVEQPESDFVFRISERGFALYEADGKAWVNEAMANVRDYLEKELLEYKGIKVLA